MNTTDIQSTFNLARFEPGQRKGHYESYFQRANHPTKPLAFWIRYTAFIPHGQPEKAIGELWAVYFDGLTGSHTAVKREMPALLSSFDRTRFHVSLDKASLDARGLKGGIASGKQKLDWDLKYTSSEGPLFLFPESLYAGSFPKAKVLVGSPLAEFSGTLRVNGKTIKIQKWPGSQNHNWGSKHTDHYAWGQVSGFDNSKDTFLELATARLKIGPLWTPAITPVVLLHKGREYKLNELVKCFRRANFGYFYWDFHASSPEISIKGRITAERKDFVCLRYYNPPGGSKFCLNTKIAACDLEIQTANGRESLHSKNRAAFEILTDAEDHGMTPAC